MPLTHTLFKVFLPRSLKLKAYVIAFAQMHQCQTWYHDLRACCISIQQAHRHHSLKKRLVERGERIRMVLENSAVKIQVWDSFHVPVFEWVGISINVKSGSVPYTSR